MRCIATGWLLVLALLSPAVAHGQSHDHPAPEKLGKVNFPTTCAQGVQADFERGVALLHSFAYSVAERAFHQVEAADPQCAMAFWGEAMANFHALWDPPVSPAALERGKAALGRAHLIGAKSEREQGFIAALTPIFDDAGSAPYRARALRHEEAMRSLAARFSGDTETQVFFALALLATAPPDDKSHRNQKEAVAILEPLYRKFPQHPGIAHYLIHACDNAELAPRGLAPARDYSTIAPSAPHALHMPSHIFTRLGMWSDSIQSNVAAQAAAHQQDDVGEELHAMDYLVYAYLQTARYADAAGILRQLGDKKSLDAKDFKVSYAATAIPVRYAIERRQWAEASRSSAPTGAPPHVEAVAAWARAVGHARAGDSTAAHKEIDALRDLESQLRARGSDYWAVQVHFQFLEASAWTAQAEGGAESAITSMRAAADQEDGVEKLPVTPGPIVPAREQLGDLLLQLKRPQQALAEYEASLLTSPGRRGAVEGALHAAQLVGARAKAKGYEAALKKLSQ